MKQDTATFVHERQYYHWQYLRNQEKVVRMEIMPDGTRVEIKTEEPAGNGMVPEHLSAASVPGSEIAGTLAGHQAQTAGDSSGAPIQISPNGTMS